MYIKEVKTDFLSEQEVMYNAYVQSASEKYDRNNVEFADVNGRFVTNLQQNQIREALIKGYVEMSQLNLTICRECLHAEYEADYMMERLVNGG